jgi:hypothetical protein
MNPKKNGLPQGFGANPLHCQQRGNPKTHQPGVMQPKMSMASQMMKKPPVPPPVYRPQPVPKVLQTKSAVAHQPVHQTRSAPIAPSAYRPQPVPKVLQTKVASGQPLHAGHSPRKPVAPPVYRPEPKRVVQPKMTATAQAQQLPKAPPVYRPQPTPRVLQTKNSQIRATAQGHVVQGYAMKAGAGGASPRVAAHQAPAQTKVIQRNINSTNFEKSDDAAPLYMVNPAARGTLYGSLFAPPPSPAGLYKRKGDVDVSGNKLVPVVAWTPNVRFLSQAEMNCDINWMYDSPDGQQAKLDLPALMEQVENPTDDTATELPTFGVLGKNDCASFALTMYRSIAREYYRGDKFKDPMKPTKHTNNYPSVGIGDMMLQRFQGGECNWHGATVVAQDRTRHVTLEANVSKDLMAPEFYVRSGVSDFVDDNLRGTTETSRKVEITKSTGGQTDDLDLERYQHAKTRDLGVFSIDVVTTRAKPLTMSEQNAFGRLGHLLHNRKWDSQGWSLF